MNENTKKNVLIVEDDEDIRLGLRVLLSSEFVTSFAQDGITAMAVARREVPDAIVLDLGLPGGDGFKVMEWLRDIPELCSVPVIVFTGQDGEEIATRAFRAGATEVFHKPADPGKLTTAIRNAVSQPLPSKTILVVDDNADTREAIAIRLRAHNFGVLFAADGHAALSVARKNHPDLVLLDLGLPGGEGFSVIERLKRLDAVAGVPVVVLSGRDAATHRQPALEAGAAAYLQKPTSPSDLLETIGAVL